MREQANKGFIMKKIIFISAIVCFTSVHAFNTYYVCTKAFQAIAALGKAYMTRNRMPQPSRITQPHSTRHPYNRFNLPQQPIFPSSFRNIYTIRKPNIAQSYRTIKPTTAFLLGAGVGAYGLYQHHRVCYAAETDSFWDVIQDPVKLSEKIANTPKDEQPELAVYTIRELGKYLDNGFWQWSLSRAISWHPKIAHILVYFLIQYPAEITQNAHECVEVTKFLMSKGETLSRPIYESVIQNRSALQETTYGPPMIELIEQYERDNALAPSNRVISSE